MKKVVLITGASSGIGKSIGEYLHNKGFIVYGTSRNPEKATHSLFPLIALDVRNKESIIACVTEIVQKEGQLDVVINNAGVGITGPIEEIPTEEIRNNLGSWDSVFRFRKFRKCLIKFRPFGLRRQSCCNLSIHLIPPFQDIAYNTPS